MMHWYWHTWYYGNGWHVTLDLRSWKLGWAWYFGDIDAHLGPLSVGYVGFP